MVLRPPADRDSVMKATVTWAGYGTGCLPAARRALRADPRRHPGEITAAQATHILEETEPSGAVARARCELAAAFLDDLRCIDALLCDTQKRLTVAVRASGTTVTEVFGAGPVIAATMIGYAAGAARFPSRDRFAACNGTAPIEVSSGTARSTGSRRGNRRPGHAVHMAAVTQIRHRQGDGRAYYDRKVRNEAPCDRAEVKDLRHWPVAAG